jgi:hypothetical protein
MAVLATQGCHRETIFFPQETKQKQRISKDESKVQFRSKTDFLFPAGENEFSLLKIVHTGYCIHPASCSVATGVLSRG